MSLRLVRLGALHVLMSPLLALGLVLLVLLMHLLLSLGTHRHGLAIDHLHHDLLRVLWILVVYLTLVAHVILLLVLGLSLLGHHLLSVGPHHHAMHHLLSVGSHHHLRLLVHLLGLSVGP